MCRFTQTILILIKVFFSFIWLGCVDFGSWNRVFLTFWVLLLSFVAVFLLLVLSFSRKLYQVTKVKNCQFKGLNLKFFFLRIFYQLVLNISFGCSGISSQKILKTELVYVFSSKPRLYICLSLSYNCFLYNLDKTL